MERSLITTSLRAVRRAVRALMNIQSRSELYRSASVDPRVLSDHLLRDLGLLDGPRDLPRQVEPQSECRMSNFAGLWVKPHAS